MMHVKPVYYDGNGETKQVTSAAQPQGERVSITAEARKSISGNPYVFVK
ncbi:hypothetical protein J7E38_15405 [Bacillus sp. ISL-35]|nr:hypothetical protein [Bacillus sp. ISL-35]MBT2680397.1 hypothetical protein [Bacillus sp. ISL-35]MBT2704311.1 hypothetical protein [Chryseobacterium sp. ISL-80]